MLICEILLLRDLWLTLMGSLPISPLMELSDADPFSPSTVYVYENGVVLLEFLWSPVFYNSCDQRDTQRDISDPHCKIGLQWDYNGRVKFFSFTKSLRSSEL